MSATDPGDRRPQPHRGWASAAHVAPDSRGADFYAIDPSLSRLLPLYLSEELFRHLEPSLHGLGILAGGRLDELATIADRNPPLLHARDRFGRDRDWIEYHSSYREMEALAFGELGMHAMVHRGGVLGWPEPLPAVAKYAYQYLFTQAEFGLMCPVSVTDTSIHLIRRFGSDELKAQLLPRMTSQDLATLWKGTQFMTERAGGSDVGAIETVAVRDGDVWRLHGEKWFCSHADADVALLLARPEGAPRGTAGLALFAMPRHLEDGERNSYRIVRLKDKLGTRSMASGEILLEGARAWLVGDERRGFRQMMEQVNLSRLSHGVRAAAMMRRCFNEARAAAAGRLAFGRRLDQMPMVRRQLVEILLPAEQALSLSLFAAAAMDAAGYGAPAFRRCRRSRRRAAHPHPAAQAARLPRQRPRRDRCDGDPRRQRLHRGVGERAPGARRPHRRAVGRHLQHRRARRSDASGGEGERAPARCSARSIACSTRARRRRRSWSPPRARASIARSRRSTRAGAEGASETRARRAASALYHAASAALLLWEGARLGGDPGARRVLLADLGAALAARAARSAGGRRR